MRNRRCSYLSGELSPEIASDLYVSPSLYMHICVYIFVRNIYSNCDYLAVGNACAFVDLLYTIVTPHFMRSLTIQLTIVDFLVKVCLYSRYSLFILVILVL